MSEEPGDWDSEGTNLPPRNPRIASRRDCSQSGWRAFAQDPEDRYVAIPRDSSEYRRVGYVSIWIGWLPDERTLELYIRPPNDSFNLDDGEEEFCPLWDDLGFAVIHESIITQFCECRTPIEQLVSRLIGIEYFREALLASCRSLGMNEGNAVIAIYGMDYSGRRNLVFDRLRYLGSFQFCGAG
jgi:hypothetical protein